MPSSAHCFLPIFFLSLLFALSSPLDAPAQGGPLVPSQTNGALDGSNLPQPNFKSLDKVEPRIDILSLPIDGNGARPINTSGSYYLSGNLSYSGAVEAIIVNVPNVTIDLMGFTIDGTGSTLAAKGITVTVLASNVCIRNGKIINFDGQGIVANFSNSFTPPVSTGGLVENLIIENTLRGFYSGHAWIVRNCVFRNCSITGARMREGSLMERCIAVDCGVGNSNDTGIYLESRSVARYCKAIGTDGDGFSLAGDSIVESCSAVNSTLHGFRALGPAIQFINCFADNNGDGGDGAGLFISDNSLVQNCRVSRNDWGIRGNTGVDGCLIISNFARNNTGGTVVNAGGNTDYDFNQSTNSFGGISDLTARGAIPLMNTIRNYRW